MGLTQLIEMDNVHGEVGPSSPVGDVSAAAGKDSSGGPSHAAFWLRPVSPFGRFGVTSPDRVFIFFNLPCFPWPRPASGLAGRSALSPELHTLDCSAACPGRGTSAPEGPAGEGTPPPALHLDPYDVFRPDVQRRRTFLVALASLRQSHQSNPSPHADQREKSTLFQRRLAREPSTHLPPNRPKCSLSAPILRRVGTSPIQYPSQLSNPLKGLQIRRAGTVPKARLAGGKFCKCSRLSFSSTRNALKRATRPAGSAGRRMNRPRPKWQPKPRATGPETGSAKVNLQRLPRVSRWTNPRFVLKQSK